MIVRLDERAARDVTDRMERQLGDAGRVSSASFSNAVSGGLRGLSGLGAEVGRGLRDGIDGELRGLGTSFDAVAGRIQGIGAAGFGAVAGVAAIGVAAGVVVKQLYDIGSAWDDIGDSIAVRTGKIGSDLTAITDVVKQVGQINSAPLEQIGDIAGRISQSMQLTGEPLARMTDQLSSLSEMTGESVNVRELGKTFSLFDITDIDAQRAAIDDLLRVSQGTGVSFNEVTTSMRAAGKAGQEVGLSFQQTAGIVAAFEQAGLDAGKVGTGLSIALKNLARDGIEPVTGLQQVVAEIQNLVAANREAEAIDLSQRTFGKGYIDFLNAIKGGDIEVESFNRALANTGPGVDELKRATDDWQQSWDKLVNTMKTELEPAASTTFSVISLALDQYLIRPFRELNDLVGLFKQESAGLTGPSGPMPQGYTPSNPLGALSGPQPGAPGGTPPPPGFGSAAGRSPVIPGNPFPWGYQAPDTGGGSSAPTMPVVPFSGDPMSLLQGMPVTSSLYSAAEGVLNAQHARAQAESDLNTLLASNESTAEDIQDARNKLVETDQDIFQAELRLSEAKTSATEKYAKTLEGSTAQLGEIGAQLDADFGISKGLAGIAENITKFVANLAAAPLLGQLSAISQANPSQGGYGLMGVLGAQGAFGPQYTGIDYSAQASALGPTAFGGGLGTGGAPTEAQVKQIAAAFGLQVTSEDRPGDPGYHGKGMALDLSNGSANTPEMRAFADYMAQNFGSSLKELIYSDGSFSGLIGDGQNVTGTGYYGAGTLAEHQNHVHIAADWGAGGAGGGGTGTGGLAGSLYQGADGRWHSSMPGWDHLIQRESSGINQRQGITDVNSGGNEAEGLFQITPKTWAANGGTQYAPGALGATPQQQADIAAAIFGANPSGSDWGAGLPGRENPAQLSNELQGGTWPGYSGVPAGITGGGGQSPVFGANPAGPGIGNQLGGPGVGAMGGPGTNPTMIGGGAGLSGYGKGGAGVSGGLMDAAMMAAGGLDLMMPGMGQVAQTGMKLANRAIEFGSQAVGIGVQGAIDTWIPFGGSKLASSNWLTRIVGGFAGAAPALPNMAGKASNPKAEQVAGAPPGQQQGQGAQPDQRTFNANITNNQPRDEGGSGRDALHIWKNQGPGM